MPATVFLWRSSTVSVLAANRLRTIGSSLHFLFSFSLLSMGGSGFLYLRDLYQGGLRIRYHVQETPCAISESTRSGRISASAFFSTRRSASGRSCLIFSNWIRTVIPHITFLIYSNFSLHLSTGFLHQSRFWTFVLGDETRCSSEPPKMDLHKWFTKGDLLG